MAAFVQNLATTVARHPTLATAQATRVMVKGEMWMRFPLAVALQPAPCGEAFMFEEEWLQPGSTVTVFHAILYEKSLGWK